MNNFKVWKSSAILFFINSIVSHIPSRHIRYILLKLLGMKIGKKVSMYGNFEIRGIRGITLGDNCSIGPRVLFDGRESLVIGNNVTIAAEAMLWSMHHDKNDSEFKTVGKPTEIGDYAWICTRAIILPGVKIGKYAVIAAGAVVTRDVKDFEIVGGVPAKCIGIREKKDYLYNPYNKLHFI